MSALRWPNNLRYSDRTGDKIQGPRIAYVTAWENEGVDRPARIDD